MGSDASCIENLLHCHHWDRKRRFFHKLGYGFRLFVFISWAWALVWCPLKTPEVLLLYAACMQFHPAGQDHNHLHQWWKFSCNGLWHNRCWSDSIWGLSLLTKPHHYLDFTVFLLTTAEMERWKAFSIRLLNDPLDATANANVNWKQWVNSALLLKQNHNPTLWFRVKSSKLCFFWNILI